MRIEDRSTGSTAWISKATGLLLRRAESIASSKQFQAYLEHDKKAAVLVRLSFMCSSPPLFCSEVLR